MASFLTAVRYLPGWADLGWTFYTSPFSGLLINPLLQAAGYGKGAGMRAGWRLLRVAKKHGPGSSLRMCGSQAPSSFW